MAPNQKNNRRRRFTAWLISNGGVIISRIQLPTVQIHYAPLTP